MLRAEAALPTQPLPVHLLDRPTADLQELGQFPLAHSLRPLHPDVLPLLRGQARPPAGETRLPAGKTWETFEHDRVPLALQQQLGELADGNFVERGVNVLAYRLVQDLLAAKRDLSLPRQLRRLDNYDFLLLDDLGYLPQGAEESEVLFTLIAERYERRSLGITSNLVFSQWEHIFANPMATAAAIDRVVHHSVILEFDVPSYRTGVAQQRGQKKEVNRQE